MQKLQTHNVLIIVGLLALAGGGGEARADVGLVEVCLAGASFSTEPGNLCPTRAWERPAAGKAVLSCGSIEDPLECTWGAAQFRYRPWESIGEFELVQTCAADIEPGVFGAVDPCGSGGHDSGKPRLPKRNVVVSAAPIINGRGTVTFSWVPPTVREDGTPLTNLAGYTLGYGTESRNYTSLVDIDNGAASTASLELELDGPTTIYFALSARDSDGLESAWSNEVVKVFALELEELPPAPPGAPELVEVAITITCTTAAPRTTCTFVVGD